MPKTGGATLTGALANRVAARDSLLLYYRPQPDLRDLDRYRYVSAHVPFSFLERFDGPRFVFTFLRDPLERALSAYSFYRTRPDDFYDRILLYGRGPEAYARAGECLRLSRDCSIEEFIDRAPELAVEYFGNRQARLLCGSSPEGGKERLDDAVAALERCDFVGLSERLDESTDWLARRLGWNGLTPLPRINVTGERLGREEVSEKGIDALLELTSLDRELYRHGVGLYERRLAEWEAAGEQRDDTAEVADAKPMSEVRFDEPIPGGGWVGREQMADGSFFCWMGHSKRAWVELAPERADSVIVEIPHALDAEILGSLRICVNGRTAPHRLSERDGLVVASATLPRWRLRSRRRPMRVELEVERTTRPCDVNPDSSDDRQLSIGVRRIAIANGAS